jgi:cytochrome c
LLGLPPLAPLELSTPLAKAQSGASSQSLSNPSDAPRVAPTSVQQSANPHTDAQAPAGPVGPAPAQPSSPTQSDTPGGNQTSKAFYVSTRDMVGTAVKETQNQNRILGRLEGFIVDPSTAVVAYALVDQGGLFGFDTRHVAVPFGQMRFFGQWDAPAIDVSLERLAMAPPVSDVQLEAQLNDPLWRQSVSDFWKPVGPSPEPMPVATAPDSQTPNPTTARPASTPSSTARSPAAPAGAIDPARGKSIVGTVCAGCHTDTPNGGVRVGPDLYGVYGRPVANSSGYRYSRGLAGHKGNWDATALDAFLKNPRANVPGTYMTFPGISSDHDRQDVIAYLKTLSAGASQ